MGLTSPKLLVGHLHRQHGLLATASDNQQQQQQQQQQPSTSRPSSKSFHAVLQQLGKTVFRPGGSAASAQLHAWSGLTKGHTAIEIAGGMGTGGMALAKATQCQVLTTDLDESRLARGQAMAHQQPQVASLLSFQKMDMFHMEDVLLHHSHFDAALVEACLTHVSTDRKRQVLHDMAQYADQILLHEICVRGNPVGEEPQPQDAMQRDMARVLRIGFEPLSQDEWVHVVQEACGSGWTVDHVQTGPLALLSPQTLWHDEGLHGCATMAWKMIAQPDLRDRVMAVQSTIEQYQDQLGYILIRAVKQQEPRKE